MIDHNYLDLWMIYMYMSQVTHLSLQVNWEANVQSLQMPFFFALTLIEADH